MVTRVVKLTEMIVVSIVDKLHTKDKRTFNEISQKLTHKSVKCDTTFKCEKDLVFNLVVFNPLP